MKVTIDFENGMEITLKPENLHLIDNGGRETVMVTKTDKAVIPLIFFPNNLLATPAELKAREDAAIAAQQAQAAAQLEAARLKAVADAAAATQAQAAAQVPPIAPEGDPAPAPSLDGHNA